MVCRLSGLERDSEQQGWGAEHGSRFGGAVPTGVPAVQGQVSLGAPGLLQCVELFCWNHSPRGWRQPLPHPAVVEGMQPWPLGAGGAPTAPSVGVPGPGSQGHCSLPGGAFQVVMESELTESICLLHK